MNICLYGASSPEIDPVYLDAAYAFGRLLAQHGHTLVYGGGAQGVMGAAARGAYEAGGKITGIAPTFLQVDGTHIHAVNREDACEEPAFEPLTVRGGQLESGCYYLTEDWTLDEPLCVAKNGVQVTLCLNGYSLSLADGAEGCIIYLAVSDEGAEPSVLTITDCNGAGTSSNYYVGEAGELIFDDGSFAWQEAYIAANEKNALAGGRITGATAGAISVGDYNQLYLSGVNIIDNEGRYGAGVVIAAHAKAVIDSCVIAGNRLTGEMKASERQILGGGVYCAGELELCGTTNLTGNRAQDAQNNLWLDETGTVTIGTLGLDKQARRSSGAVRRCTAAGTSAAAFITLTGLLRSSTNTSGFSSFSSASCPS